VNLLSWESWVQKKTLSKSVFIPKVEGVSENPTEDAITHIFAGKNEKRFKTLLLMNKSSKMPM